MKGARGFAVMASGVLVTLVRATWCAGDPRLSKTKAAMRSIGLIAPSIAIGFMLVGCAGSEKTENPVATDQPPTASSSKPQLVVAGVTEAPSSVDDTGCLLPGSPDLIDAVGVPLDDFHHVYVRFPKPFRTTKEFGVKVKNDLVAWSSESDNGPHQKVML